MYDGHSAIGFGHSYGTYIRTDASIGIGVITRLSSSDEYSVSGVVLGLTSGSGLSGTLAIEQSQVYLYTASSAHTYAVGAIVF